MVMPEARLILICGLPGSGKTTLAKQLAPKVPAVRLSPDEWKHDLGIDYYDDQRRVRLENRLWRLGQELLTLGQSVILENGFWTREERDELRLRARRLGVAVELHYLDAPVEELWRRLKLRNDEARPGAVPIQREDLQKWALQFEAPYAAERALFDEAPVSTRLDATLAAPTRLDRRASESGEQHLLVTFPSSEVQGCACFR